MILSSLWLDWAQLHGPDTPLPWGSLSTHSFLGNMPGSWAGVTRRKAERDPDVKACLSQMIMGLLHNTWFAYQGSQGFFVGQIV